MGDATLWRLRTSQVSWRKVDNELVVLDLHTSEYLTLNHTGAFLWALLETGATAESLSQSLMGRWDVDRVTAEKDVHDFLHYCLDADFIEPAA